jgi:hypothetical protein
MCGPLDAARQDREAIVRLTSSWPRPGRIQDQHQ